MRTILASNDPDLERKIWRTVSKSVFRILFGAALVICGPFITLLLPTSLYIFSTVSCIGIGIILVRNHRFNVIIVVPHDGKPLDDMPDHIIEAVRQGFVKLKNPEMIDT